MKVNLFLLSAVLAVSGGAATPPSVRAVYAQAPAAAPLVVGAGAIVRVRLNESVGTQRDRPGDRFDATLESPLIAGGQVAVPRGAQVYGIVREARPSGRLKGRAVLMLALESVQANGRRVPIRTASQTRVSARHRKRNLLLTGGGAGLGASIGAIAGGGVGAAIGAGAGAAAGLTTAVITGRKQVRIPAETVLTFRLERPLTIQRPVEVSAFRYR